MRKTLRRSALSFAIAVAITYSVLPTSSADAAGHFFCVNYANTAVSQQNANQSHGCGYFGLRWHRAWNLHYDWCLGVANWRANSETTLRGSRLNACGA
jgi:hypothetical protein